MQTTNTLNRRSIARITGLALLASIIVGIISAVFVAGDIDINLSADVLETAQNMLGAEQSLRAKAYLAIISLGLNVLFCVGLFLLLKGHGHLLAAWSLLMSIAGTILSFLGAVFALNVAEFVGNEAYATLATESQRFMLVGVQATSDYTSFHLGLLISALSNVGFFYLFLRSGIIPKLIASWGVFASLFVFTIIVLRDFIPTLGNNMLTMAFMLSNMIALVSLGLYLVIKGVRE